MIPKPSSLPYFHSIFTLYRCALALILISIQPELDVKSILFTNLLKSFRKFLIKSLLSGGQAPPLVIMLVLSACLSMSYFGHSSRWWSMVWSPLAQGQFASGVMWNRWKYALNLPRPVSIVVSPDVIGSFTTSLSAMLGKYRKDPNIRRPWI